MSLSSTFSCVLRISTGTPTFTADQLTMVNYGRGRGPRHGKGHVSREERGGGHWNRKCDHYRCTNHISYKCWEKFDKPKWTQNVMTAIEDSSGVTCMSHIVTISEYDGFLQFQTG